MIDQYADAGVDVSENDRANDIIKSLIPPTFDENVVSGLEGLFSAGYKIDKNEGYFFGQKLVVVDSLNDLENNIGSAISDLQSHDCVPLFVTDYLAFGKLWANEAATLVSRVIAGSRLNGKFLPVIGGEVAEMPGVIKEDGAEVVVAITYQTDKSPFDLLDLREVDGDILTASIDSVGTKTKLGLQLGLLDNLFKDMIGHSVGDVCVQSAVPLGVAMYVGRSPSFERDLTDYYEGSVHSSGLNDLDFLQHSRDIYCDGQFDIVGSVLGVVDRDKLLTGEDIKSGDLLVGWKCFGVNTNGYSLIRKLGEQGKLDFDELLPASNLTVGQALMQPHEDYRAAMKNAKVKFGLHLKGAAHITGGGIEGNVSRLLPDGLAVSIDSLPNNSVFEYLQERGNLSKETMNNTYNQGVGVVFVVNKEYETKFLSDNYHVIGKVVKK